MTETKFEGDNMKTQTAKMNNKEKNRTKYELAKVRKAVEGHDSEDLRCLYTEYSARMRTRGTQIWNIGAVFIPLSISGIAFLNDDPNRTLAVAVFSTLMIWIWFTLSTALRDGFEQARVICATLETVILNVETPLCRKGLEELIVHPQRRVWPRLRHIRLAIPIVITAIWLIVVVLSSALSQNKP
jgi:hypothetical protein